MVHTLTTLIGEYGLVAVFVSAFLEQVGAPIPALPVLVVAGAAVAGTQLPAYGVVIAAMFGCLVPDLLWYWLGRRFGARVMRGLCKLSLSPDSCVHQSELNFERWRGKSLLIAKFVPGLSIVAPPLVGACGLPLKAFMLLDGIGSLLWVGVGVGLGWLFAGQINRVLVALAGASKLALVVVLTLLAAYVLVKWLHRRHARMLLRIARFSARDLNELITNQRPPLILDVRSRTSRELDPRIITGARLADAEHLAESVRDVPFDRDIVSYCSCPNEATSARVALALARMGYHHAHPLAGGLTAWEAADYATHVVAPHSTPATPNPVPLGPSPTRHGS